MNQDSAAFHKDILDNEAEMARFINELDPIEDGERLSAKEHAHEYSRRTRTQFEQRVDFAQAQKTLDRSEQAVRERLKLQLKNVQDETLKAIEANKDFNSDYVAAYTVNLPDTVQRTLQDMFEAAWNDGRDAGSVELPVKERKTPAVQDVKTFTFGGIGIGFADWPECWCRFEDWQNSMNRLIHLMGPEKYSNAFEPTEAINAFQNRAWLIKDVIGSTIQQQVRYELFEHLKGGRTLGETINNIRQVFEPWVGDPSKIRPGSNVLEAYRISAIVRTESTFGFNQGRLAIADAAGAYITGFSYSAILDERTSDLCNAADGLVLRKDAPTTIKLAPPNHVNCRSILVFVTTDDAPVHWSTERQINKVVAMIPKGWK